MAMMLRAEATIHAEKCSLLYPCRLRVTLTTPAAFKAATSITDRLNLQSYSQGIGTTCVLVHFNIYSKYDQLLGCLQGRYNDALADGTGNGNGNGNGDDEQHVEATIDAAESQWCIYFDY